MSLQEAFNKIWERAKDPRRSMRQPGARNSICAYRSPDGLKCFIGVLLPDTNYDPRMDGHGINLGEEKYTGLTYVGPLTGVEQTGRNVDALFAMQRVHDGHEPCDWQRSLRYIAERYQLTVPESV